MISPILISILIVVSVSALLVVTGLKKNPSIGVLGALVVLALTLWLRGEGPVSIGFGLPDNPLGVILLGLFLGIVIQLLSVIIFEPLSEKLTQTEHDHSVLAGVKGSWKAFLIWMLVVWVLVAVLEEGLFRGFLMTEVAKVVGSGFWAQVFNILFTSAVFGLSHGYQNRSGILSTGLIGVFLAVIFVLSGGNLWLAIFTHGFIDTSGIALIALDWEKRLRYWLWRAPSKEPSAAG